MKYLSFILLLISLNLSASDWDDSLRVNVATVDDVISFFKAKKVEIGQKAGCPVKFNLNQKECESGYSILAIFDTVSGSEIEMYFLFSEDLILRRTVVK